jgi:hypothetical protein
MYSTRVGVQTCGMGTVSYDSRSPDQDPDASMCRRQSLRLVEVGKEVNMWQYACVAGCSLVLVCCCRCANGHGQTLLLL